MLEINGKKIELDSSLDVPAEVIEAARKVEMIVMDVDGVLTDGHTYQLDSGEQFLCFCSRDGTALALCAAAGLHLAVVSGRELDSARIRMGRFQIAEMHLGCANKELTLLEMSRRLQIPFERMAYIGDDLMDLPIMLLVGLPVAVPGAIPEVLKAAAYCTRNAGGEGAVRELIILVLKARGLYEQAVEKYLRER